MIFLETIFFLLVSSIVLCSLSSYGEIISNQYKKNFFENVFFGILVVSLIVTFIHFFIEINEFISLIILLLGLILFVKNFNLSWLKLFKNNIIYLVLFLTLLPIFLSQKYHEDFGYYHLPYVVAMIEKKIIFGLANSNIAFSHNSIWLNIISIFSLPKNNFNLLTLPTFLIYFTFIAFSIEKIFNFSKIRISSFFLIVCIFYFILKFTRISEFGNDLPSTIFSILSIFFFLKYSEETIDKNKLYFFFCCIGFAVFAILIKFSAIPVFLLPLYLYITNYKKLKKEIFKAKFIFILLLSCVFFIQQFIYTGCFLFPSNFSCLEVSWFNNDFVLVQEKLEIINKSFSSSGNLLSKKEYLTNFNWFPFWIARNYTEILEHIITMLLPIILFIILLQNEKKKINLVFKYKISFYFFLFIGFIFWLQFSPVYRFGVTYFLTLVFLVSYKFYINKKFSKKIFLFLIIISLIFNFSKNISRISEKANIFFGIEKIDNKFLIDRPSKNKFIIVRRPDIKNNTNNGWQGRLCWDISFLCSYNELKVNEMYGYLFFSELNN